MSAFALDLVACTCAVTAGAVVGVVVPTEAIVAIVSDPAVAVTTGRMVPLLALGS